MPGRAVRKISTGLNAMGNVSRFLAFGLAGGLCALAIHAAAAQDRKPAKPPAAAPAAKPSTPPAAQAQEPPKPAPGWISRCMSDTRQNPVDCAVEQTAVVTNTGQLVASVVVRVPHDTRQPVMMIQVPVGLYLPAGINIQVDESKSVTFALQTCDLKGCYAGAPLPQELLDAMKSGKKLAVIFQNLQKENITVPLPLDNFAEAFQKIQ